MSKFINIVTINIKNNSRKNYIKKSKNITNFDGLVSSKHVAIDSNTYCMIEEWRSKEALVKARKAIELANEVKPLINEKSTEIDIIGSLSGSIIAEKEIKKNQTEEPSSGFSNIEKIGNKYFYYLYRNF